MNLAGPLLLFNDGVCSQRNLSGSSIKCSEHNRARELPDARDESLEQRPATMLFGQSKRNQHKINLMSTDSARTLLCRSKASGSDTSVAHEHLKEGV